MIIKIIRILISIIILTIIFIQFAIVRNGSWLWYFIMQDKAPYVKHGFGMRLTMNNNGLIGCYSRPTEWYWGRHIDSTGHSESFGLRYPAMTENEHIYGGGIWVGAIVRKNGIATKHVSTGYTTYGDNSYKALGEMLGYHTKGDSIFQASILDKKAPNRRGFDDDGDGRIDEDELDGLDNDGDWIMARDDLNHNGKPDHGEPNVDEDYGAISEQDTYFAYRDSFPREESGGSIEGHVPLNIKVFQKAYAWDNLVKEPIIPIDYYIINRGLCALDSVYVGFFWEGVSEVLIQGNNQNYLGKFPIHTGGFLHEVRTAYVQNKPDPLSTPLGVTFLGASKPLQDLRISYFNWPQPRNGPIVVPQTDNELYNAMSSGTIMPNFTNPLNSDNFITINTLISVGPFHPMNPGDTIKFSIALVGGYSTEFYFPNNIWDNVVKAIELYDRKYMPASFPPSPPLKIKAGKDCITLDWKWYAGCGTANPLDTWDESNKFVNMLPDTHWRKRNPPDGRTKGGRIFEGFKIWRSDYPVFQENQMSLVKQFDVDDDLGFEGQTGLQFTYVDSNIVRGRRYWYAVTSFTIPDQIYTKDNLNDSIIVIDSVLTNPIESSIHDNVIQYSVPFYTSTQLNEVRVVPNPYRTDKDYTFEGNGWEGLGRNWDETKRLVWFIHLPKKCTVRIYSMTGEIIKTIEHDDEIRNAKGLPTGQEEFYLLSESNRILASGVYIYSVESEYGKEIGKFVVIR
jgi:hypothetical protein